MKCRNMILGFIHAFDFKDLVDQESRRIVFVSMDEKPSAVNI